MARIKMLCLDSQAERWDESAVLLSASLSDGKHRRETTARCTEVRRLPLIEARRNELHDSVVGVVAHIDLERAFDAID